jgi:putative hydroxymethylpyrimidine transport system substrate-binding protein
MRSAIAAIATLAALALAACGDGDSGAPRHVTLALDFMPNAVHAGVYTAAEQGLDFDHGVELEIRAPSGSTDSLKLLEAGRADIAIADIHDLGLARERGADLVGVGAIVQRPLAAVIAHGVGRPRELEGRRVGVTGLPSDDAVLRAVVEHDGGHVGRVRKLTIGFAAVPSLASGRVAAVTAFWNAEGVALRRRGVETREFRVDDYGAPRYPELVLVVTRKTLEERRDVVQRTLAAIAAGTEHAVEDPAGAAARIARASDTPKGLVGAQLAAVTPALLPAVRLDRGALEAWARFDARFGILKRRPDVERAFAFGLAPAS